MLAAEAAKILSHTRCYEVMVLDVSRQSDVTDYFVIASGTSPRQMRTACDDVEEMAKERGYKVVSRAGYEGDTWILADFVDMVVHIFSQDARFYYDLESLWGDAPRINWRKLTGEDHAGARSGDGSSAGSASGADEPTPEAPAPEDPAPDEPTPSDHTPGDPE